MKLSSILNRYTVGIVILVGWVILSVYVVVTKNEGVGLVIGAWITMASSVAAYYFGTTASSQHKTELLAKAQPVDASVSDPDRS